MLNRDSDEKRCIPAGILLPIAFGRLFTEVANLALSLLPTPQDLTHSPNAVFRNVQGRSAVWWRGLISSAAILFASSSAWALPQSGTPAPPLQFTQLLQAPEGARADWDALRGKVVVLEFWATWCEVCVAEPPHSFAVSSANKNPRQYVSPCQNRLQPYCERRHNSAYSLDAITPGGRGMCLEPNALIPLCAD
jgi:thiol-disulfide isomerase/thioredoxin